MKVRVLRRMNSGHSRLLEVKNFLKRSDERKFRSNFQISQSLAEDKAPVVRVLKRVFFEVTGNQ